MLRKLYSIRDDKVKAFAGPIFEARNDQDASRMLHRSVNDPNVQLSLYPEDFSLYSLGTFDDETGLIKQDKSGAIHICGAISLKELQKREEKNG